MAETVCVAVSLFHSPMKWMAQAVSVAVWLAVFLWYGCLCTHLDGNKREHVYLACLTFVALFVLLLIYVAWLGDGGGMDPSDLSP